MMKDWASGNLVLKLASSNKVEKVVPLDREEYVSINTLCAELCFMRLKIFAVNAKKSVSNAYFIHVGIITLDDIHYFSVKANHKPTKCVSKSLKFNP